MPIPISMPTMGMVVVVPGLIVIPHPNKIKTIVVIVVIMRMVVVPRMVDLQQKPKAALALSGLSSAPADGPDGPETLQLQQDECC